MRLAVDGREFAPGIRTGIGRYLREVLRAAAVRGWTTTLYADAAAAPPPEAAEARLVRLRAPATPIWDHVLLPRALARSAADVFLSPYYKAPLRAPCPVVVTIHDTYFIDYPGRTRGLRSALFAALARNHARRATAIVTDSEHSRALIAARLGVDAARIAVVPVAVGPEFRPCPPDADVRARYRTGDRYLLYIGNFRPHKNLPRLLGAWAQVPRLLRDDARLVLGGGGDGRLALASRARALGVAESVVFAGHVDDADLAALYSGAVAVVVPSLEEGFGLPAVEAMACGAPVIVSNRGALPEVTAGAAVVVDAGKEDALAAAMARLLVDPAERASLARRGRARAEDFVPARTSARLLDLVERVARG